MTNDKYGETLHKGDTVSFLQDMLMIIGVIIKISNFKVTVLDESNKENSYILNGRKVVKLSGSWKTKECT